MKAEIGNFLKSAIPMADTSLSQLMEEADSALQHKTGVFDEDLFSPLIVLSLPRCYYNREGRRVDICGVVSATTKEYAEGYRYYSSNALFFFEDGTCTPSSQGPQDLISLIDTFDIPFTTKPLSLSAWVHPKHYAESSFFESLERSGSPIKIANYYLNRMGFVVEIVSQYDSITAMQQGLDLQSGDGYFTDASGQLYQADGRISDQSLSMSDLVFEIVSWDLFNKTDWSEETLFTLASQSPGSNAPPELFNPIGESRLEKKKRLFDHVLAAYQLAKDLNIDFGYHINDMAGLTPSTE